MRRVLVHGFSQTGASWAGVLDGEAVDVVVGDDLWSTAGWLGEVGGTADYVGYSMGGRLCLHLALARPDLVRRLVLLGATAGIDDEWERLERRTADEALAASVERDGADAFLQRWLAQPLFARLPRSGPRQRDPAVLAASLRRLGTGVQEPLWDRLPELRMPVLVLAGDHDTKFVDIGRRLAAAVGANATFATVAGAGHAAHLERPAAFRTVVEAWLRATEPRPQPLP